MVDVVAKDPPGSFTFRQVPVYACACVCACVCVWVCVRVVRVQMCVHVSVCVCLCVWNSWEPLQYNTGEKLRGSAWLTSSYNDIFVIQTVRELVKGGVRRSAHVAVQLGHGSGSSYMYLFVAFLEDDIVTAGRWTGRHIALGVVAKDPPGSFTGRQVPVCVCVWCVWCVYECGWVCGLVCVCVCVCVCACVCVARLPLSQLKHKVYTLLYKYLNLPTCAMVFVLLNKQQYRVRNRPFHWSNTHAPLPLPPYSSLMLWPGITREWINDGDLD